MKMYILVREGIPIGHAINSAAHASLACFLKYEDDATMNKWVETSFKKVVCLVGDRELKLAQEKAPEFVEITESALDGELVCVAFAPQANWPSCFNFFRLFQ